MTNPPSITDPEIADALKLVDFLDDRYGEDLAAFPEDSPGAREALAHRMIVHQARVDLTSASTADEHLPGLRAVATLRELGRRWAGNHGGVRRHPGYRSSWLPASYPDGQ